MVVFLKSIPVMLRMAVRGLLRQKKRSGIIAATAAVGIIAVVASKGFMNGFTDSIIEVAVDSGLGHVQIRPEGYLDSRQMDLNLPMARSLEKQFKDRLPEGVHYAPRMEREGILRIGSETRGVLLLGVDPELESGVSGIPGWPMESGAFDRLRGGVDSGVAGIPCLLGGRMSRLLEVEEGGRVVLSTGSREGGAKSFVCRVSGVYTSPSGSLEESLVLINLSDLSTIRNDGPADEVGYFVFRGGSMDESEGIAVKLRGDLAGVSGIEIASLKDMEPLLGNLIDLYDSISWIFYFIILAGFGIVLFESVTMSVFERMHEIGILHAIGSRPSFLFGLVTTESIILTLVGTGVGLLLGSGIVAILSHTGFSFSASQLDTQSWGVSSVSVIYPFLKPGDYLESTIVAVIVGFLSILYPARKAVKISPLEAIHRK